MSELQIILHVTLIFYCAAAGIYLWAFQRKPELAEKLNRVGFVTMIFGVLGNSYALTSQGFTALDTLQYTGVLLSAVIVWIGVGATQFFKFKSIGVFISPVAALILLIQAYLAPAQGQYSTGTAMGHIFVNVHVLSAIIGQAFAISSCAVATFYLWQHRALKQKLMHKIASGLPALDKLHTLLLTTLWVGFIFLSIGLISGAMYSQVFTNANQGGWPIKLIWAVTVWVWYLSTLLLHNVFKLPLRRLAQMSLAGFILLALSFFGMLFVSPSAGGM